MVSDTSVRLTVRISGRIGVISQVISVSPFRMFCGDVKVSVIFFENHSSVSVTFPREETGFLRMSDSSS